jgi:hypothetical protein
MHQCVGYCKIGMYYSIYVFLYQVGKVGYNNLVSLEWYCGGTNGGVAFKCKWSKPSQMHPGGGCWSTKRM